MATNDRIFYACQAVNIVSTTGGSVAASGTVKGVQSIGMSANFTLDQVFEMGQLEIYENIEDVADIEVTLEKVIDGEKFIWEFKCSFRPFKFSVCSVIKLGSGTCHLFRVYFDRDVICSLSASRLS